MLCTLYEHKKRGGKLTKAVAVSRLGIVERCVWRIDIVEPARDVANKKGRYDIIYRRKFGHRSLLCSYVGVPGPRRVPRSARWTAVRRRAVIWRRRWCGDGETGTRPPGSDRNTGWATTAASSASWRTTAMFGRRRPPSPRHRHRQPNRSSGCSADSRPGATTTTRRRPGTGRAERVATTAATLHAVPPPIGPAASRTRYGCAAFAWCAATAIASVAFLRSSPHRRRRRPASSNNRRRLPAPWWWTKDEREKQ